jgi:diguanylate cyclase (GGDEF)-like protein
VLSSSTALATQRLAEFLAVVAKTSDVPTAIQVATERAAGALEAEVSVVLDGHGEAISSVGFAVGRVPLPALVEIAAGRRRGLDVPGAGACHAAAVPLESLGPGHLLVARSGEDCFNPDEMSLLRGMARVLDLTVEGRRAMAAERGHAEENVRLVTFLKNRQRLLEQISEIQRAITRREPLLEILDSIAEGAQKLFGDEVVGLRMADPDEPDMLLLVSARGMSDEVIRRHWRVPVTDTGVSQLAFRRDRLEVMNDYADNPDAQPDFVAGQLLSAMAAPVHEGGRVVGSLAIGSLRPDRFFGPADQAVLQVFAEQVSLAVTDARTQEAMRQAFHDSLTGLASRALFLDRLDHALARADREGTRLAVLFVDLDRFKNVNDSLGHPAGDRLLVGVAERLRTCLCADDTAARLGGDEFAIVLEAVADEERATSTARRIIDRLRAPFVIDGQEAYIDASVGIAFNTDGESDAQSLIRNADLAM